MARVVHIRDWKREDPLHVYIGRAGKGETGYWGNPVQIGRPCPECKDVHRTAGSTLPCYESWLKARLQHDAEFTARMRQLRGKVLVCFCKPGPCHGDVLARYAVA